MTRACGVTSSVRTGSPSQIADLRACESRIALTAYPLLQVTAILYRPYVPYPLVHGPNSAVCLIERARLVHLSR